MRRGPARVRTACITVLGSGFAPVASGTWGSLVAVGVFLLLWWGTAELGASRGALESLLVLGVALASWLSVAWGSWAVERFRSRDPKPFVLDEFAGQWMSLLVLPIALQADWWSVGCVVGGQFVLFRILDVIKPPPARQAERLRDGWGILTDDLVAGLYANLVGQCVWRLTPAAAWLGVELAG